MRNTRVILLLAIAGVSFFIFPRKAQAIECTGRGWVGISSDKSILAPGQSATIKAVFKWTASNVPAGCTDQEVTLTILGTRYINDLKTENLGRVAWGEQREISATLNYETAEWMGRDRGGAEIEARATVGQGGLFTTPEVLGRSTLSVSVYNPSVNAYACIDANQKWRCSKDGTMDGCLRDPGCQINPKGPCQLLADKGLCNASAPTTTAPAPTGTGLGGETIEFDFSIPNPLESDDLLELIEAVGAFIFDLAIPIAVIMIIYAGVLFLISRGDQTKVAQARKILTYAVIGLAIVLIGSGFISLITDILNLGGEATPTPTTPFPT